MDHPVHVLGLNIYRNHDQNPRTWGNEKILDSLPGHVPVRLPVLQRSVVQPLAAGLLARDGRSADPVVEVAPHLVVGHVLRVVLPDAGEGTVLLGKEEGWQSSLFSQFK